jgi:hypothetical protein
MVVDTSTVVWDLSVIARVQGWMISSPFFLWLCAQAVDGASRAAASSSIESDRIMGASWAAKVMAPPLPGAGARGGYSEADRHAGHQPPVGLDLVPFI